MLKLSGNGSTTTCDGITRRDFLQVGTLGVLGFSLSNLAALHAAGAVRPGNDGKSAIMIFNLGAPSQLDTWDMKPDAPREIRGPFQSIKTNNPDIQISEIFPRHARLADKFSLVRTCYHTAAAVHDTGHQMMQTGRLFTGGVNTPHARCASAYRLMTSDTARQAFDLAKEPEKVRERYGQTRFGQCCLLARRLVEAGVRFVTINTFITVFDEITWDIHGSKPFTSIDGMKDIVAPMYDQGYSALIEDLFQRGMLDSTLVCNLAEFGRTPKINPAGGRDHWPQCWTTYFAGGGVKGGRVVGKSDEIAGYPVERPVKPPEVVATIFHSPGLDLEAHLPGPQRRPFLPPLFR